MCLIFSQLKIADQSRNGPAINLFEYQTVRPLNHYKNTFDIHVSQWQKQLSNAQQYGTYPYASAYTHIFSHPDPDKLSELAGFGSVKFVHRL